MPHQVFTNTTNMIDKFQEPLLLSYLVKTIEPLSEADPQLVANYVVALLKKPLPKEELQGTCITNLEDFLGEHTESFVKDLFRVLEDKTVLESAGEINVKNTDDEKLQVESKDLKPTVHHDRLPSAIVGTFADPDEQEGSNDDDDDRNPRHTKQVVNTPSFEKHDNVRDIGRKRGRSANLEQAKEVINDASKNVRESVPLHTDREGQRKFPKTRHGATVSSRMSGDVEHRKGSHMINNDAGASGFDSTNGRVLSNTSGAWGSHESRFSSYENVGFTPLRSGAASAFPRRPLVNHGSTGNPSWVAFNPIPGIASGVADQSRLLYTGLPAGYGPPLNSSLGVSIGRARIRCTDFEERGFCLRGDMCPMEHGKHIVVNDVQSLEKYNLSVPIPSRHLIGLGTGSCSGTTRTISHEKKPASSSPPSTSGLEPDLYDPDQPLLNNGQQEGSGIQRFPSFRKGDDASLRDGDQESLESGGSGRFHRSSVWDRIGPADYAGSKPDVSKTLTASSSVPLPQLQQLNQDPLDDDLNCNSMVQRATEPEFGNDTTLSAADAHAQQRELKNIGNSVHGEGDFNSAKHSSKAGHSTYGNKGPNGNRQGMQKAQCTVYVAGIPSGNNKAELLLSHFKKFGEVVAINIPPNSNKAFVRFSTREEAVSALASPEAVMGNRFIRLSWANWDTKRDGASESGKVNSLAPPKIPNSMSFTFTRQQAPKQDSGSTATSNNSASQAETAMTVNNHSIKSLPPNVSRPIAVPAVQKQESAFDALKMIREKQEMLARKREEFRKNLEKLAKQGIGNKAESADKNMGLKQHRAELNTSPDKTDSLVKSESTVERIMGLGDDDAVNKSSSESGQNQISTSVISNQANCQALPKSAKVAVSCHPGMKVSPNRFKLDNRTTVFRILPPLPDGLLNIDSVKNHFAPFGDVTSVEFEDSKGECIDPTTISETCSLRVTYSTRRAAEKAFLEGRCWNGQSLQFSWVALTNCITNGSGDIPPLKKARSEESLNNSNAVNVPAGDKVLSENFSVQESGHSILSAG